MGFDDFSINSGDVMILNTNENKNQVKPENLLLDFDENFGKADNS